MKKYIQLIPVLFLILLGCQKDQIIPIKENQVLERTQNITIEEAIKWFNGQSSKILDKYPIRWNNAKIIATETGGRVVLNIPGQPVYQNVKQGYRQLSIHKNSKTDQIEGKFLEIIPDALYFQRERKVEENDFTGKILEYDLNYKLERGTIYSDGKPMGEVRPADQNEKVKFQNANSSAYMTLGFEQNSGVNKDQRLAMVQVIESCGWTQSSYVDSEGLVNIVAERYCNYYIYDDGSDNFNDPGIVVDVASGGGGGGGSSSNNTSPPPPSNLPGENNNNVNPKKMVECFGSIPNEGAAFQVKVLVVEPMPGTSFNVGPNSFGHVAIQLTKVKGNQSITQTMGFYGSGSGLDKLVSSSTIKDNGDIDYNMDASYYTDAANFQNILDYVSNPPKNYHFTDFNCAAFVYNAAIAGNLPVPNPTTTFGIGGPGGVGSGMSPAGWGSALRSAKEANPSGTNINRGGGTAPASKGECN